MSGYSDAIAFGVTAAEIAWPIVLVLCVAIMIWPFLFLLLALRNPDSDAGEGDRATDISAEPTPEIPDGLEEGA